ncbi:hypothetical protein I6L39_07660 [Aeromonas sp. FDAARGOS 1409]|uniref:hypothetical protein n=1 Tax=Aeromonas sp. FDAARGOS 1409 TaxID=2778058 RepID=UPI001C21E610|nr:hypothetical protein [Aeromonas sp. FDAARGOS 1409]QXC31553.1 hypothetical protein I6L39_07660 [Aeromonas sp. FDAARGOS 1409]
MLLIIVLSVLLVVFSRLSSDYGENFYGVLLTYVMANVSQAVYLGFRKVGATGVDRRWAHAGADIQGRGVGQMAIPGE